MQRLRAHRRLGFLVLLAALVGLAASATGWLLLRMIAFLTNLIFFDRVRWTIPSLAKLEASPRLVIAALAGALIVSVLARMAPAIRGHGIPEAMEAVLERQSRVEPRTLIAKPISIAISIATGAPFGAEGPIIVTGGGLGSVLGQALSVTPSERRILLGCGAAGGTAAIFGSPIAAVLLAIELLLFEFSPRVVLPLAVSSSVAGGAHAALFGSRPLFHVPDHHFSGLGQIWLFALLGIGCGVLAIVLCRGLFAIEALYRRLPVGEFWHPLIGALCFALIGLAVPRALGTGYATIQDVLSNRLALGTLGVLLVAKLVAWWLALGSGTSGSTLAPIILVAGAFGAGFGRIVHEIAPGIHVSVGAMAIVAMAATFGASIGASLTAIVFAFELTRDYQAILPLMLATVLADLVARQFLEHNLMTEKLARRGVAIPRGYEPDVLRTTSVRSAMSTPVDALPADSTVGEARRLIEAGRHSAYPLIDGDGRCSGIVTRTDLLADDRHDNEPLSELASSEVVTVTPADTMLTVLERMIDEHVEHVPVVEDGRLIGICTRTDLLRARGRALAAERPEPGWLPTWPRARRTAGSDRLPE